MAGEQHLSSLQDLVFCTVPQGVALGYLIGPLQGNCKHLANANKFGQIRKINGILGLYVPTLVTPLELLGEDALP